MSGRHDATHGKGPHTARATFENARRESVRTGISKRTAAPPRNSRRVGGNCCHLRNFGF